MHYLGGSLGRHGSSCSFALAIFKVHLSLKTINIFQMSEVDKLPFLIFSWLHVLVFIDIFEP